MGFVAVIPQRFQRIEDLIGARLEEATELDLQRFVDGDVPESEDLEFKLLYGPGDEAKSELAKDVAALANQSGGVILVGMAEAGGRASKRVPQSEIGDAAARRFRSIVAGRVFPRLSVGIRSVESNEEPGKGYVLIAVPRSSAAPHAVIHPNGPDLIYPVRDGSGTRYLAESEIADRYGRRFSSAQAQQTRLAEVVRGTGALDLTNTWMAVAAVPDQSGRVSLDASRRASITEWIQRIHVLGLSAGMLGYRPVATTVGQGRVSVAEIPAGEAGLRRVAADLHMDGSTFYAWPLHTAVEDTVVSVEEFELVKGVAAGVDLAARHAIENVGAGGTAMVMAWVIPQAWGSTLPKELALGQRNIIAGGFVLPDQQIHGTRRLIAAPTSTHTVDFTAIHDSAREMLIAARIVAMDLVQAFGLVEVLQITDEGRIRPRYCPAVHKDVEQWAAQVGVDVDSSTVNIGGP